MSNVSFFAQLDDGLLEVVLESCSALVAIFGHFCEALLENGGDDWRDFRIDFMSRNRCARQVTMDQLHGIVGLERDRLCD